MPPVRIPSYEYRDLTKYERTVSILRLLTVLLLLSGGGLIVLWVLWKGTIYLASGLILFATGMILYAVASALDRWIDRQRPRLKPNILFSGAPHSSSSSSSSIRRM